MVMDIGKSGVNVCGRVRCVVSFSLVSCCFFFDCFVLGFGVCFGRHSQMSKAQHVLDTTIIYHI